MDHSVSPAGEQCEDLELKCSDPLPLPDTEERLQKVKTREVKTRNGFLGPPSQWWLSWKARVKARGSLLLLSWFLSAGMGLYIWYSRDYWDKTAKTPTFASSTLMKKGTRGWDQGGRGPKNCQFSFISICFQPHRPFLSLALMPSHTFVFLLDLLVPLVGDEIMIEPLLCLKSWIFSVSLPVLAHLHTLFFSFL